MDRYVYEEAERRLLEESQVPFAIYQFIDKRVVTVLLSAGFCTTFGFDDRAEALELMDNDMYRDAHPDDVAEIADAAISFATEGGNYSVIYRSRIKGEYRIIHAHGKHIYKENGTRLAVVWYADEGPYIPGGEGFENDLNKNMNRLFAGKNLYQRASYDFLTGLPTMAYFFELAEEGRKRLLSNGENPAMIFIDLSGMKRFNRKHGLSEGDNLIRAMARLLVKYFSSENCCRIGGDHFAAYTISWRLDKVLKKLFEECRTINDGKSLPVRVGVYLNSSGNVGAATACDRAKMACDSKRTVYTSHASYFNKEMLEKAERRQYIVENLDRALKEGWIKVYHQPIIRAANGKVSDEEALSRWIDPVRGFMSPGDFIPVLEETKLIYKLDLFVAEQILKKMKRQKEEGLYVVPESVNLSRSDFDSCDIVEEIKKRVDESGISRDKLTIEITESVMGGNLEFMKEQIARFQGLGFKVWMDDYGSGYSSPDLLQQIQFDVLKLDMVFMKQFDKGEKNKIIVTELVRMALALGIETVCEGVETEEQVEFLREIGCTKLQGFYFLRPVPLDELFDRYSKGVQIGFENPAESGYYEAIGKVNLYDFSFSIEDDSRFKNYFNTMPMAIFECGDSDMKVIRGNRAHRDFVRKHYPSLEYDVHLVFGEGIEAFNAPFVRSARQCAADGKQLLLTAKTEDGDSVHFFMRRIAKNPVSGVAAISVVTLDIIKKENEDSSEPTWSSVAMAFAPDYINLFYVDLDTDRYIEYSPDGDGKDLSLERRGENFFEASRREATRIIAKEDRERFVCAFTKENIVKEIEENGSFTIKYDLIVDGQVVKAVLEAVRLMRNTENTLVIGASRDVE